MIVAISCGKKNDSENDDDNIRNTQEIIVDNLLLNVESNEASAMEESYRVGGKINLNYSWHRAELKTVPQS